MLACTLHGKMLPLTLSIKRPLFSKKKKQSIAVDQESLKKKKHN